MLIRLVIKACAVIFVSFYLLACRGGSGGSGGATPSPSPTDSPSAGIPVPSVTPDPGTAVTLSGQISYDFVPNQFNGALDYDNIESRPVRTAVVLALEEDDTPVARSITDDEGRYSLLVDRDTDIKIRVYAALVQEGNPSWDFKVTDNTNGNAIYVMDGALVSSGSSDSARDLHASSGWTGSSYEEARAAAPFAILDNIYDAVQLVLLADPTVNLAPAELRWSVENTAVSGSRTEGLIGTSFYDPSENNMYILGDDDNDTDEYDRSVILHEWAHYFEDNLSRSDSIGGAHNLTGAYDMRVAFGEGFANAFAAIASETPFYTDSAGVSQSLGFAFSLEQNGVAGEGWFSENSVSKLVYDVFDSNDDGSDTLSLGFSPIYETMTSLDYILSPAMTSIYLFTDVLRDISQEDASIEGLLNAENIEGRGIYGEGETNDSVSNSAFILPVYNALSIGDTVNVCGNNRQGEYNGVDVRRFFRLSVPFTSNYTISVETTDGTGDRNPAFVVHRNDGSSSAIRSTFNSSAGTTETSVVALTMGEYVLEVYDQLNVDGVTGGGASCFDVSIN